MSIEQVRIDREDREVRAKERASILPPGDYYAYDNFVYERQLGEVMECESHWDACLVMMATPKATAP